MFHLLIKKIISNIINIQILSIIAFDKPIIMALHWPTNINLGQQVWEKQQRILIFKVLRIIKYDLMKGQIVHAF